MQQKPQVSHRPRAFFVALVGPDAAGKSSLALALRDAAPQWVFTHEPWQPLSVDADADAFTADRARHVRSVILPALSQGRVVVTDRYYACTAAYQGRTEHGARKIFVEQSDLFPPPDLWVRVTAPVHVRLARLALRGEVDHAPHSSAAYAYLYAAGLMRPCMTVSGADKQGPGWAAKHIRATVETMRYRY